MKRLQILTLALLLGALATHGKDERMEALKDLNGYFPFTPPQNLEQWQQRGEYVRRQILVAMGLWPMPTKTPLNAVIHGKIECDEYTVEKVYFESAPGLFVTGSLYRPKRVEGRVPGVLFAHGHWTDARLALDTPERVRQLIADGAERFESGGRSVFQSLCVQLARMGCVVWQWDMLSDSDAIQFSREVVHLFKKQRPEMNTTENWGLYSPQAEAHLQSILGLQTLNAVRGLDFLLSLPEVDPTRVAMTGASGGGTQTMLLAAIDERLKLSFPVVMVSTAMQGGCTCENASLLRVNSGNIEFAALFAPKPQGMNTANDWTKELATKGFPELQQLYSLYGAKDKLFLLRGEHFPHNYNAVTRSAFYTFLNQHFKLQQPTPVIERDFEPLTREQLTVWDAEHPAPKADDPDFERRLLKWLNGDTQSQLRTAAATDAGLRNLIGKGVEVVIGRTFAEVDGVTWQLQESRELEGWRELSGLTRNQQRGEEIKTVCLLPAAWQGRVALWLGNGGFKELHGEDGSVNPAVARLLRARVAVVGANLLLQGGEPVKQTRVVENPREAPCYTFGYNHALFAQRTHDVMTLLKLCQSGAFAPDTPKTGEMMIAAWGECGAVAIAARALAGAAVSRMAADTQGFRFGQILDYRDPRFLPGGAKYLDLPGMMALGAPHPTWLTGEKEVPQVAATAYQITQKPEALTISHATPEQQQDAAVAWLLE